MRRTLNIRAVQIAWLDSDFVTRPPWVTDRKELGFAALGFERADVYGTRRANLEVLTLSRRSEMPNRDENNPDLGRRDSSGSDRGQSGSPRDRDNSEWLRDQTGEDHNLSGSSTYRTLPDQPDSNSEGEDGGSRDAKKRQSNR